MDYAIDHENDINREEALERSEEKYRALFEHIDQGFCVIEVIFDSGDNPVDYRFLETNPAFERHTGLRDAVGKTMRTLAPDHEDQWFRIYGRVAKTGEPVHFENPARALDRFYEVYAYRIGPAGDRRVGILFKDITQRKRNEKLLRDMDRRKDEFMATLAHELRNPLAPIRNSVNLLKHPDVDLKMAKSVAAMMERQVNYLVRLVDDLLYIARISSGKLELRLERLDLAEAIREAVEMSRPLLDARNHDVTVELPGRPIVLLADRVRLAQVIANLLNNAAKYSDKGSPIRIRAFPERAEAVIHVKDQGIGIAPEMVPRIFEMFMQAPAQHEGRQEGLGIGLTLAKRLVELHGGSVSASSEGPGKGSEFCVRLPIREESLATGASQSDQTASAPDPRRRVLIADDNIDAVESLRILLELDGHEIRTAHDGVQAMEAAEAFTPDIALVDLGMPRMNGYEVARRMSASPRLRNVTLVALTGWGQPEDRMQTARAGFKHHLTKPVDMGLLQRLLHETPARH